MKRIALLVLLLVFSAGSWLIAQNPVGIWQGALHANNTDLRTVVKFSMDDGKLNGVFYSLDQGGDPFAISSITRKGDTLEFVITLFGGSFSGKFSADGNSIVGAWTQGAKPIPLTFVRASADTAWDIPKPKTKMARTAEPGFEVATIKPTRPAADNEDDDFSIDGRNVATTGTSLVDLIDYAYDMHRKQVEGAPDWARSELYDIAGVPDQPGEPSNEQAKSMIRKLLADRFQLKFHLEKKELPVYLLIIAKSGLKNITRSADQSGTLDIDIEPVRGGIRMTAENSTLTDFATFGLQADVTDRPVQDRTGRTERYDFALTWMPDESQFRGELHLKPGKNPQPDLFTAIQDQLGLKLEPAKAAAGIMVIDHVEKPSPN